MEDDHHGDQQAGIKDCAMLSSLQCCHKMINKLIGRIAAVVEADRKSGVEVE